MNHLTAVSGMLSHNTDPVQTIHSFVHSLALISEMGFEGLVNNFSRPKALQ